MSPVCSRTLAAGAMLGALLSCTARAAPPAGSIYAARVDSIIHPVSAEYMIETIDRADRAGGGARRLHAAHAGRARRLDARRSSRACSPRRRRSRSSSRPSGARAASAGFILTIAADVAAMAPGTHIGAAHPVAGGGEKMDETMAKKAAEDVAAYVAHARQRPPSQRRRSPQQAVNDSRAFTEAGGAARASPPLIDLVAPDVPDLLRQLDGRTVTRFDGTTVDAADRGRAGRPDRDDACASASSARSRIPTSPTCC